MAATEAGVIRLSVSGSEETFLAGLPQAPWIRDDGDPALAEAARQLEEYFSGRRRRFEMPLDLCGTPFQKRVWAELQRIPYGETWSYARLAGQVGTPKGFRAVGHANGSNPVAIIVPCHRVIGSDGSLGGYTGGLDLKARLLEMENRNSSSSSTTSTPIRSQPSASGPTS
jgi:O-6-methylguanine DNA methyltransferase